MQQSSDSGCAPFLPASIPTWVWLALLPVFLIRLVIAWLPISWSLVLTIPDDGFYYFTIARNIAAGSGVTFDRLAPTNGFHPLWMALLAPLWWIAGGGGSGLPVHLALTLGGLFDVITVLGIWHLAVRLIRQRHIAGMVMVAYAWNPYNLAAAVNGMETSLSCMLLVWSLVHYLRIRTSPQPGRKQWLVLGLLWSLLFLARLDNVIIVFPCFVDLMWCRRKRLRNVWSFLVGGTLLIPWLVWSLTTFGSITPVSGKAYPYYLHAMWENQDHTRAEWIGHVARRGFDTVFHLGNFAGFSCGIAVLAIAAVAILGTDALRRRGGGNSTSWESLWGLVWPTAGAIALLLYHGAVRWMLVAWYFVPASILIVLWFGVVLDRFDRVDRSWPIALAAVYFGFQLLVGAGIVRDGGMWPNQREAVREYMPRCLELCERYDMIGISDAGYWGYILPCRVVNLDGVVNNRAFDAIVEGRLREYLDEIGLEYAHLNDIVRTVVERREGPVPETPPFAPGNEGG